MTAPPPPGDKNPGLLKYRRLSPAPEREIGQRKILGAGFIRRCLLALGFYPGAGRERLRRYLVVASAMKAASIIAGHTQGSETKALITAVTSLLSHYQQESILGLAFSPPDPGEGLAEILNISSSSDFRHLASLTFQLGLPEVAEEVLPQAAALAQGLAGQVDGLELITSPILIPSSTETLACDAFQEIFGGQYLPPVVETATLGSGRRDLAKVGEAYTRLPAYAKREI